MFEEKPMTLTPVVKSADPYFNHDAAAWAYETVMKMDADSAWTVCTLVMAETLQEEITKNSRTLQRHLNEVITKRATMLSRALDRVVAKGADGEQAQLMREALEEISKAGLTPYDYGYVFDENQVRRDRAGKFTFKVTYSGEKTPIKEKYARGIPSMPNPSSTKLRGASDEQIRRYQEGYYQVARFIDNVPMIAGGDAEKTRILYHFRDKSIDTADGGRIYTKATDGDNTKVPDWDPKTEEIVGMEIKAPRVRYADSRNNNQVELASFGLISALGANPVAAHRGMDQVKTLNDNLGDFASDWTGAGADGAALGSSNAPLYGRVATGSNFLSQFQTEGSLPWMATKFAQFTGERGPEAEKVIGPKIRRTIYRYRGIQKKPEAEIVAAYDQARGYTGTMRTEAEQKQIKAIQQKALNAAVRNKKQKYPNRPDLQKLTAEERREAIAGVEAQVAGVSGTPAEAKQYLSERGRNELMRIMTDRLPDATIYDLQLKAGHTPPSEGLILDKNGKIVAQAVGYADDHYLPFNLKELKGLRGGSYIRTRSVGGPTTEDIYTGLVMGARQIIVVSRSGRFIVEFDPDFHHMRRYNDKAARMVSRYGKILDAVQSKQADRMPLESDIKAQIRAQVMRDMPYGTGKEKSDAIARKELEYKMYPRLSDDDKFKIDSQARAMVATGGFSQAEADAWRAQKLNAALDEKAYVWQLNGDGYAAALEALHEQFPYYLKKPIHITRKESASYEAAVDRGYVKPRYLRPEQAQEGYFDISIAGESKQSLRRKNTEAPAHGKNSADTVDYQNWKYNSNNQPAPEPEKAKGVAAGERSGTSTRDQASVDRLVAGRQARELAEHAVVVWDGLANGTVAGGGPRTGAEVRRNYPALFAADMNKDDFIARFSDPSTKVREQFDRFMRDHGKEPILEDWEREAYRKYRASADLAGGTLFDRDKHVKAPPPSSPYGFSGSAYSAEPSAAERDAEMRELNEHTVELPGGKKLEQLGADDFRRVLTKLYDVRQVAETYGQADDKTEVMTDLHRRNLIPEGVSPDLIRLAADQPEVYDQQVENVYRYWRLFSTRSKGDSEDLTRWETDLATPGPEEEPPTPAAPAGPSTPPRGGTPGLTPEGKFDPSTIRIDPKPPTKPAVVAPETKAKVVRVERGTLTPQPTRELASTSHRAERQNARAQAEAVESGEVGVPTAELSPKMRQRRHTYERFASRFNALSKEADDSGDHEKARDLFGMSMMFTEAAMNPAARTNVTELPRDFGLLLKQRPELHDDPMVRSLLSELTPKKDVSKRSSYTLTPLPKLRG